MEVEAIISHVVCDDTLKKLKIKEDIKSKMTNAEIMTTAIVAALVYFGNIEKARDALCCPNYIPHMLSKSQFNRRLHKIGAYVWSAVLERLAIEFAKDNPNREFIIDSCPIRACKLSRTGRNKIFKDRKDRGICHAQQEEFIGLRLHMICDINGNPVQICLAPATTHDVRVLKEIDLNLPENSSLLGDKAYRCYELEDYFIQTYQVHLFAGRKSNTVRHGSKYLAKIRAAKRKMIETSFSCIARLMPRTIHAVTRAGFELKTILFVVAFAFSRVAF